MSIDWLRFIHILSALWLAAGLFGGAVARASAKRSGSVDARAMALTIARRLTAVFTLPGAIVSGFIGFALLGLRRYAFSLPWVWLSLVLYGILLALIILVVSPQLKRAAASAADGHDVEFPKLAGIFSDVGSLVVVILTWLMVVRPG